MSVEKPHSWQSIQQNIRERIQDRTWKPGDLIPGEIELAAEYGCARSTVNRAMRELANAGIVDRKRKAGTRVAVNRSRTVTGALSVIRIEVENLNANYGCKVIDKKRCRPPADVRKSLAIEANVSALHIRSLHFANEQPFIVEDRWVNTQTVPDIVDLHFNHISVNEWLVEHVPLSSGSLAISAHVATADIARLLKIKNKSAILKAKRSTWLDGKSVTIADLFYAPDFEVNFTF